MTRGEQKRLLRQATQMRIRAERERLVHPGFDHANEVRLEESTAIVLLKGVSSVFAFAEKLDKNYGRPLWASQRYGAK